MIILAGCYHCFLPFYLIHLETSPCCQRLQSHPKSLERRTDRSFPLFFPPTFSCSIIYLFLSKVEILMEREKRGERQRRQETKRRKNWQNKRKNNIHETMEIKTLDELGQDSQISVGIDIMELVTSNYMWLRRIWTISFISLNHRKNWAVPEVGLTYATEASKTYRMHCLMEVPWSPSLTIDNN